MKKTIFFFFILLFFGFASALDYTGQTTTNTTTTVISDATLTRIQVDVAQLNKKVSDMQEKMILSSDVDKIINLIDTKIGVVLNQAIAMQLISLFFFFLGLICAFLLLKAFKKV